MIRDISYLRHLMILIVIPIVILGSAQGQFMKNYSGDYPVETITDVHQTLDGGYIMGGRIYDQSISRHVIYATKTDALGDTLWMHVFKDSILEGDRYGTCRIQPTPDGGYLVMGHGKDYTPQDYDKRLVVIKIDAQGDILWHVEKEALYGNQDFSDIIQTSDGGFAIAGRHVGAGFNSDGLLVRTDSMGDTLWSAVWGNGDVQYPFAVVETSDGGFTLPSWEDDSANMGPQYSRLLLTHVDSQGTVVWNTLLGTVPQHFVPADLVVTPNGHFAVVGIARDTLPNSFNATFGSLTMFDAQGTYLWSRRYGNTFGRFEAIVLCPDGGFAMTGQGPHHPDSVYVVKTDSLGNLEWERGIYLDDPDSQSGYSINVTNFGGYVIGANVHQREPHLIVLDSAGILLTNTLRGTVFIDDNFNCEWDSTESSFPFLSIQFQNVSSGATATAIPDADGHYDIQLAAGIYDISIIQTSPYQIFSCPLPDSIHLQNYEVDTVNIGLENTNICPYNVVDITSAVFPFNVPSTIHVQACNYGTYNSYNTSVEVLLDPSLTYVSATPAPSQIIGQSLLFDLDTLALFACEDIEILAQLDTLTQIGATHCIEASITPDTLCFQTAWTGPMIEASADCTGDSVLFTLTNSGADMSAMNTYIVYIDDLIFRTMDFELDSSESLIVSELASPGASYRIEAGQVAGFPTYLGDSIAIAFYEGCVPYPDGTFNTGFITQYYLGNSAPAEAIFCQENIAAYDPNDKLAQPKGYGSEHFIYPETPLDYTIRFQNTGNDTARRVIILDSLSTHLDVNTLSFGASSHDYSVRILGENILRFAFQPILLPDSNVNESASHGSVSFRIHPKADLPDGTVISNRAAIYFDYAAPVMTPEIFHTIGTDFIPIELVSIEQELMDELDLTVWPNPFQQQISFQVSNQNYRNLEVQMMDMQGRVVSRKQVQHADQVDLEAADWAEGMYVYQLLGDGELIARGKVVLRR